MSPHSEVIEWYRVQREMNKQTKESTDMMLLLLQHIYFVQLNSLDTCRLHPSGPFLTFDSFFRTTSFLDDTLHTLIFFFFLILKKTMLALVFIPTFYVKETEAQRSKTTLCMSYTQVFLTLESWILAHIFCCLCYTGLRRK